MSGNAVVSRFLISKGADVNAKNDDGRTPRGVSPSAVRERLARAYDTMQVKLSSEGMVVAYLDAITGGHEVVSDSTGSYGRERSLKWKTQGMEIFATFDEDNTSRQERSRGVRKLSYKSKMGF